jgi:hypothetical protein
MADDVEEPTLTDDQFQARMDELRTEFFAAVREEDNPVGVGTEDDSMSVQHLLAAAIGRLIAVEANVEILHNRVRVLESRPVDAFGSGSDQSADAT